MSLLLLFANKLRRTCETVADAAFIRFLTKHQNDDTADGTFISHCKHFVLLSSSYFRDLIKGEDKDFEKITVNRDDRGFQTVFKLFHSTISESKASILMVWRIKNDFLLDRYNRYMHV